MVLRCVLLAVVLAADVAVEVSDKGSLRTHMKLPKPTSLIELHGHLKSLTDGLVTLQSDMAKAKEELGDAERREAANQAELNELADKAHVAQKEEVKTGIQESQFNGGYNENIGALNNLNTEMVADSSAVNSNSANLNGVRNSYEGKKDDISHYEVELGSATANVRNRRELFALQITNMKAGTQELEEWSNHATPVLNTQTKAIVNLQAWITHLEGQSKAIMDMVAATQRATDSFDPSKVTFQAELDQDELNQDGTPTHVDSQEVTQEEIKNNAAIMEEDVKDGNTIDQEKLEETAATETTEER